MLQPWTVVVASHAVAATLALVLGPVQLARRPKGDPAHRVLGRVWAVLMVWVAAGSFLFGTWSQPIDIFLRVLAAWTLYSVTMGVIMARRNKINSHRRLMTGSYVGLVAAFVGVVVVPSRLVPSWFRVHPWLMSLVAVLIIGVVGALAATVITRLRPRTGLPAGAA